MVFLKKPLIKIGIKRNFLNLIKGIYENPTNIIINGAKTGSFLSKTRNRTRMSSQIVFSIVLEDLDKRKT